MRKIYYLLAVAVLGLSACQKEPTLQNTRPAATLQSLNLTLQASDYAELTSGYPKSTLSFDDAADANTYIPQILNKEYINAANGSTANVTYTVSALYWKPNADSVYADAYYALTSSDYLLLPGNTYTDFSISQVEEWLPYKFPSPTANELKLLKFTPYPSTLTPAPPLSFMYYNNAWINIYTVSPAEYTSAGVGQYDEFTTSWTESALNGAFNTFMKSDPTLMDTIKKNDIVFVSFNYYVSKTADYQRVKPLQFDGNNFVAPYETTASGTYVRSNGTWKPQPIVTHTLTSADIALIANSGTATGASSSLLSNLGSYGDFETSWTTAELNAAFTLVLQADYTTPVVGTNYQVVYLSYVGGADVNATFTFQWTGTAWNPLQH